MKKLRIHNFHVKDVVSGEKTKYENEILYINKEEALNFIKEDKHITSLNI